MKFLTFAFVINFILVCWPKLDIITIYILAINFYYRLGMKNTTYHDRSVQQLSISWRSGCSLLSFVCYKLYLSSTFETSDIELLRQKLET